jgi:hypothetical protein
MRSRLLGSNRSISACPNRKVVMSRLINPFLNLDFYQISDSGVSNFHRARAISRLSCRATSPDGPGGQAFTKC